MSEFHLQIHDLASRDLDQIAGWIAERSVDGSRRWVVAFEVLLESIRLHPESFSMAPESAKLGRELRQAFFRTRRGRTYRAVFAIDESQIRVLRVRGPGQPPLTDEEPGESD